MSGATDLLRRATRHLVGDYRLNWILQAPRRSPIALPATMTVRRLLPTDRAIIAADTDPKYRASLRYGDAGADGFVLVEGNVPRCVAHFVAADRYDHAQIWPLRPRQRAMVDIVTRPADRGRGLATLLAAVATPLAMAGVDAGPPAICFIWWNHRASLHAFGRAGWRRIGFSIEIVSHGGRAWRRRLRLRRPGDAQRAW